MVEITVRRISTGSVFKLIFLGSWIGSVPIFLGFGILATGGVEIVSWNGSYITGPGALIGSPLLGLFLATLFGAFVGSMTALGLWLNSKFRSITLICESDDSVGASQSGS